MLFRITEKHPVNKVLHSIFFQKKKKIDGNHEKKKKINKEKKNLDKLLLVLVFAHINLNLISNHFFIF